MLAPIGTSYCEVFVSSALDHYKKFAFAITLIFAAGALAAQNTIKNEELRTAIEIVILSFGAGLLLVLAIAKIYQRCFQTSDPLTEESKSLSRMYPTSMVTAPLIEKPTGGTWQAGPLFRAISRQIKEEAMLALQNPNYEDVNEANVDGDTPLHEAAEWGDIDVVKRLVEERARLQARNKHQKRPIDIAKDKDHQAVYNYLLDAESTGNML